MLPNPWLILAVVLVIIGAAFSGYFKGRHDEKAAEVAAALAATQAEVKTIQKQDAVTEQVSQATEQKEVQVRTVIQEVVKWRTKYVTKQADAKCVVPRGFVLMHDAAASAQQPVPDAAGQSNDSPSGVELSAVGETVAANYGTCHEIAQRLMGLQDWVRQQQTLAARP